MIRRTSEPRLALSQALRKYWPLLLGLPTIQFIFVFVPSIFENRPLVGILFFAATLPAVWPYAFGNAPFSFEVVTGLYWLFGSLIPIAIKVVLFTAMGLSL